MIRFSCDYQEGAHPRILEKLTQINYEQLPGYSEDIYCDEARARIRELCASPKAAVHFLVGGTQTNMTFLSSALRPHQGVIAAKTGHIAVHETGAIEATGHKVIALPHHNGKLDADEVSAYVRTHYMDASFEHMVQPKVVYISQPTEMGTLYTTDELIALRGVCDSQGLILYMDGARLGEALAAVPEMDLAFYAKMCDAFYIGGTKQGLLMGEALVIVNEDLHSDFRYIIKQHGGMLAKGWLLGVQFSEMFKDSLYVDLSKHAIAQAIRIRKAFEEKGIPFMIESPTNQQFPILENSVIEQLLEKYAFSMWEAVDANHTAVRFCTSWATRAEDVDTLLADIRAL